MDWALFWSAVTGIAALLTVSSGIVIFALRSHTQRLESKIENVSSAAQSYTDAAIAESLAKHEREITEAVRSHVSLEFDSRFAKLATEITTRINGTYMRTGEANARFNDIQRQIDNLQ